MCFCFYICSCVYVCVPVFVYGMCAIALVCCPKSHETAREMCRYILEIRIPMEYKTVFSTVQGGIEDTIYIC